MADTENKVEKTVTKKEKAEKPAKKKDKPGMFARIGNFFRNLKSEFKKNYVVTEKPGVQEHLGRCCRYSSKCSCCMSCSRSVLERNHRTWTSALIFEGF